MPKSCKTELIRGTNLTTTPKKKKLLGLIQKDNLSLFKASKVTGIPFEVAKQILFSTSEQSDTNETIHTNKIKFFNSTHKKTQKATRPPIFKQKEICRNFLKHRTPPPTPLPKKYKAHDKQRTFPFTKRPLLACAQYPYSCCYPFMQPVCQTCIPPPPY